MKGILITIGTLLVGMVVMAYLYFSNLNTKNSANDLSLNAVTTQSGLVFSFDNDKSFYEILSGQNIFQNLLGQTKTDQFKLLKEQLINLSETANLLDGQKIYIGFLPGKNAATDFLISTQFKQAIDQMSILNAIKKNKVKIKSIQNINELTFSDSSQVYIGFKDLLVLISSAAEPIQKIIAEQKPKTSNFASYIKSNISLNKNTLANLYLDFNGLSPLLKNVLNTNINGELSMFNQQNNYATFSYNFSKEKLLFNGNTDINNVDSYYKLFDKLDGQKISINNIFPQKTANYTIYAISDYSIWYTGLTQLMANRKEEEKVASNEKSINQKYGLDLKQILPKYFKNQFATFQLSSGEKFGAIALSNGEKVSQLLLDLSAEYAPDIKIFREAGIAYAYFGEPFKKFEKPYYTVIDNYLVMANNASSIQVFLNSYRNNSLLINDVNYQNFNSQLSSASISIYVGNKNSNDIFGRNLKQPYFKQYQSKSGLKDFEAFSYQLSGDKGKFLSNILLYKGMGNGE
jgi:hypothetical protein